MDLFMVMVMPGAQLLVLRLLVLRCSGFQRLQRNASPAVQQHFEQKPNWAFNILRGYLCLAPALCVLPKSRPAEQ